MHTYLAKISSGNFFEAFWQKIQIGSGEYTGPTCHHPSLDSILQCFKCIESCVFKKLCSFYTFYYTRPDIYLPNTQRNNSCIINSENESEKDRGKKFYKMEIGGGGRLEKVLVEGHRGREGESIENVRKVKREKRQIESERQKE